MFASSGKYQHAPCSVCRGTGYVVPEHLQVSSGILGGSVSYPPCKHCSGKGFCELSDEKYW